MTDPDYALIEARILAHMQGAEHKPVGIDAANRSLLTGRYSAAHRRETKRAELQGVLDKLMPRIPCMVTRTELYRSTTTLRGHDR